MIHYSPRSVYTAQRIADKVANGAYFYTHFTNESNGHFLHEDIANLINKLSEKFSLYLTPRQRTYRLNKQKQPIADLIVYKRHGVDIWDFWLFITTPESHDYSKSNTQLDFKNPVKQRVLEAVTEWTPELERQQVEYIQNYYKDHEKFKFILRKPFLKLNIGMNENIELVRLSHSSKGSKTYLTDRKPTKNYTWTWRFDQPSLEILKKKWIDHINRLISINVKTEAMQHLQEFYGHLKHFGVFKGMRHQIGQLFVQAVAFHYKKTSKDFRKMPYYVALELNYLPRQMVYADSFMQYLILRIAQESHGVKLTKEDVKSEKYDELIAKYILDLGRN